MATKRTLKQYQSIDKVRSLRMLAGKKRKAADRHEATAARFRAEANAMDAERARIIEQHKLAS